MKRILKTVCAWCPDARERTREWVSAGFEVTHGMCPACFAAQRRLLDLGPELPGRVEPLRLSCRLRSRAALSPL